MSMVAICQTGAVHHAADIAFERHIVEVEFAGLQLAPFSCDLSRIADTMRQAVQGARVDADHGVHAGQASRRHGWPAG